VLAEAAEKVGTPQIRNAGTLAGNVCQRPWCWYFRNGFPCLKNGGKICFSASGENQLHAIFGGGPSYIVHPSDTAPALVALDAQFHIAGPSGERVLPASEFFHLPRVDAARENVLAKDEMLAAIQLPAARPGTCAVRITRCWIARLGRTPWSARQSCSKWISRFAAARASCWAASRLSRGGFRK
jgi:xanthine dehydrogenase YagS FAD-binding subunit